MLYCDACTSVTAGVICPTCVISRQKTVEDLTYGRWSDCSFLVGNESHQEVIPSHKMILAMASPVFDVMFYSTTAENSPGPICVDDTEPDIFKAMLQYIYTCQVTLNSLNAIYKLCYLAKKYELQHLMTECVTSLRLKLSEDTVKEIDEYAKLLDVEVLKKACSEIFEQITKGNRAGSSWDIKKERGLSIWTVTTKEEVGVDRRLAKATFRFTIQNIRKLKNKRFMGATPTYYIWNLPWQLQVENSVDNIQITIFCNSNELATAYNRNMRLTSLWNCWAKSEVRIIPHKPDVIPLRNAEQMFDLFDQVHDVWFNEFVTWKELLDPANEYIKDDALTLEIKLTVEEPEGIKSELVTPDTFFVVKTEPLAKGNKRKFEGSLS